jgi:nicotinamidase/pyrazinamidase
MSSALLIIDIQNDFCEGGSLEVRGSLEIIPKINALRNSPIFSNVFLSQDWHPASHISFAANNPGSELFSTVTIPQTGIEQIMWPIHCIQNTFGSEFQKDLQVLETDILIKKGINELYDSYSAFGYIKDRTNLNDELKNRGVTKVYVCGLAFDYCVGNSALDAANEGYETYIITDCTKSVQDSSREAMTQKLNSAGIQFINSEDLINL